MWLQRRRTEDLPLQQARAREPYFWIWVLEELQYCICRLPRNAMHMHM